MSRTLGMGLAGTASAQIAPGAAKAVILAIPELAGGSWQFPVDARGCNKECHELLRRVKNAINAGEPMLSKQTPAVMHLAKRADGKSYD